jgi:hypothetical protein
MRLQIDSRCPHGGGGNAGREQEMGTAMRASLALPLVLALTSSSPFAAVR